MTGARGERNRLAIQRPAVVSAVPRIEAPAEEDLAGLRADEQVPIAVQEILTQLHRKDPYLVAHSVATGVLAASIAHVMGLGAAAGFAAGIVGAVHEVAALVTDTASEAEMLTMAEGDWILERARFRNATLEVLDRISPLRPYGEIAAQLYSDMLISPIARIVAVADCYDWFVAAGDGRRAPLSAVKALDYLQAHAGVRYSPEAVEALRDLCTGVYRGEDEPGLA